MPMKTLIMIAGIGIASVQAHEMTAGKNGGAVVEFEGHHVEFVPSATAVTLYLTDEKDAPIASAGGSGKLIIQDAGKTISVDLAATLPNTFTAPLAAPLTAGAKVAVSAKLADGHGVSARFVAK